MKVQVSLDGSILKQVMEEEALIDTEQEMNEIKEIFFTYFESNKGNKNR